VDIGLCERVVLGGFLSSLIIASSGSISMMTRCSNGGPGFGLRFGLELDFFGCGIIRYQLA
jgi:hypothetical protein